MEKNKDLVTLTKTGARTAPARRAVLMAERLYQEILRLTYNGVSEDSITKVEQDGLEAIREDLGETAALEKARLADRLAELESRHLRDMISQSSEINANRQNFALKVSAMGDTELEQYALDLTRPKGLDPGLLDISVSELRHRGIPTAQVVREIMVKSDYDKPWTHKGEGKILAQDLSYLNRVDADSGDFVVTYHKEDGTEVLAGENIESFYTALKMGSEAINEQV